MRPRPRAWSRAQSAATGALLRRPGAHHWKSAYARVGGGAWGLLHLLRFLGLAGVAEEIGLDAVLAVVEVRIAAATREQILVPAPLDDPAVLQDEDRVRAADGREPVRDDKGRPALHQGSQPLLDRGLVLAVERGCRLV